MTPPWKAFPHIARGAIGWRMGEGEAYYDRFYRWFSALDDPARKEYARSNPEPEDWSGFYEMIADSPWR